MCSAANPARPDRARERLVRAGASALAAVTRYTNQHPDLGQNHRLRLLELRYATLLARCPGLDTARVARQIVFGNVDRQLEAIQSLCGAGTPALSILRELLHAKHSLVRETAADAIGQIGEGRAVVILADHARSERDIDVLVTVARRLGKIRTKRSHATLCELALRPEEDVVTAALQALVEFKRLLPLPTDVAERLHDPRWRVRTAALHAVAACGDAKQRGGVLDRLSDDDPFVRNTAAELIPKVAADEHVDRLRELFRAQEALRPPLLAAIAAMQQPLDDEMLGLVETEASEPLLLRLLGASGDLLGDAFVSERFRDESRRPLPKSRREALRRSQGKYVALLGRLAKHPAPAVRHAVAMLLARDLGDEEPPRACAEPLLSLSPDLCALVLARHDVLEHTRRELVSWRRRQRREAATAGTPDPLRELTVAFLGKPTPATTMADLQRAFLGKLVGAAGTEALAQRGIPVRVRLYQTVEQSFGQFSADSGEKLVAAVVLVACGNEAGLPVLNSRFDELDDDHREALAILPKALPPTQDTRRLLDRLLASSKGYWCEVLSRNLAEAAGKRAGWGAALLELVARPGSGLDMEGLVDAWDAMAPGDEPQTNEKLKRMAQSLLQARGDSAARAAGVFVLAQVDIPEAVLATSARLRQDADPLVRRAAWQALLANHREQFLAEVDAVVRDPSSAVRSLLTGNDADASHILFLGPDQRAYVSWRDRRNEEFTVPSPALRQLVGDIDPAIRVGAMLALDLRNEPPAPGNLASGMRELARKTNTGMDELIQKLFGWNLARAYMQSAQALDDLRSLAADGLSPKMLAALQFLVANKERLLPDEALRSAVRRLLHNDDEGLQSDLPESPTASFAAIQPRRTDRAPTGQTETAGVAALPGTKACKVVFFHRPGCRECREAEAMLRQVQNQLPGMTVERWNLHTPDAMRRNEALCARLGVEERLHLVAPAILAAGGALVNREISLDRVVRLVLASQEAGTPDWDRVDEPEMARTEVAMRERFAALDLGIVLVGGLLDGVNPCAFATVVFLLSYLQLRGHRRRHLWQTGAGFIVGVFVAYYLLGLGLAELLEQLRGLTLAGRILRWSLVGVVAVLAVLNVRDGVLCLRGRMGDMLLQLPDSLKRGIHSTVRRGVRMAWLFPAAFAMGALISVLELACTGQVYGPTILYILRSGVAPWRAAWLLGLYNLAFVLPLVAVFVAALFGVGNAAFRRWLESRAATVKFATALLFLAMLVLMLR